jgi:hypothetical protein
VREVRKMANSGKLVIPNHRRSHDVKLRLRQPSL